jgi:hypothetical protein
MGWVKYQFKGRSTRTSGIRMSIYTAHRKLARVQFRFGADVIDRAGLNFGVECAVFFGDGRHLGRIRVAIAPDGGYRLRRGNRSNSGTLYIDLRAPLDWPRRMMSTPVGYTVLPDGEIEMDVAALIAPQRAARESDEEAAA